MDKAIKAKWVAALRSGEYKQGKEQLRNGDKFCCLGVLCNLHAQAHPEIAAKEDDPQFYMGNDLLPHQEVTRWAGLNIDKWVTINDEETSLYAHNDIGRTFAEIADAIEAQL